MNYQCKMFQGHRVEPWNEKLSQLSVQRKFFEVTELEAKNYVWKQILLYRSAIIPIESQVRHPPNSSKLKKMGDKDRPSSAISVRTDCQMSITYCQIALLHLHKGDTHGGIIAP